MAKIVYSADSTCDLSRELIEKTGVSVIPLTVILGENSYHDGVDIFPEDIYSYVSKTGILPKTSAASQYEFSEHFKKLLSANPGCDVLHFSLSDQLSCSYRNAAAAAEELSSEAGKIYVIDGRVLSTGTALLLLKAQDLEN
ncbi:MAG: DegV family EDD domain-containing protein, partial [Clostridia bacterium]|nr:DegV family EDD domain-containing protein [Clostridia bacterium]